MIATVRLGPDELAEILRDYCESRGYTYFQHGFVRAEDADGSTELIELHIELPTTPLGVRVAPVAAAVEAVETLVTVPAPIVAPPQLALDLGGIMDPESTPDGTRTTKAGLPPVEDNELAGLFRAKLPPESKVPTKPIIANPADNKAPF